MPPRTGRRGAVAAVAAATLAAAAAAGSAYTTQPCARTPWAPETLNRRGDGALVDAAGDCVTPVPGSSPPLLAPAPCGAAPPTWTWGADGSVSLASDPASCLNVNGASTAPNASVILWPCTSPPAANAVFSYNASTSRVVAAAAGLCLSSGGPPPPPPAGAKGYLDAVADCGADPTGSTDTTAALQACIVTAYDWRSRGWPVPVLLPPGVYTVSDTLTLAQENPGPDDGINVVPARFLSLALWGSAVGGGRRATLRLAPSSPGFGAATGYKPVVRIYNSGGEGVDMNNVFANIDIDLAAPGNPGAAGIVHAGAQGATVTDVVVTAGADTFACFAGLNGAGGAHSSLVCRGARYGLYVDDSQPVPVGVGVTLVGQSVAAVYFAAQESMSLVGLNITLAPGAAAAVVSVGGNRAMSVVDTTITCPPASGAAAATTAAVTTPVALFLQDVYVWGCDLAVQQGGADPVPGPPSGSAQWMHIARYARGDALTSQRWFNSNVMYLANGTRVANGTVLEADLLPPGGAPPADLQSRHVWELGAFPGADTPGVANARADCGAVGDDKTDDWAALQACVNAHAVVFLPPGRFRLSATLALPPGVTLVGMGASFSFLLAATDGLAGGTPADPAPLVRTADDAGAPTTLAFLGLVTWQHLPGVTTLDWRARHPASLWRVNFESRDCECLWTSAYQQLSPPAVPCKLPANLTSPKSLFRGAGRVHSFVNDDTGVILSTAAGYRSLRVADTAGWATPATPLRFYSLNLEHAQSEANGDIINASYVTIYSIKCEGNVPLLWVRAPSAHVAVLGMGGGFTPFAYNFSFPPDQTPATPSAFRVDAAAADVTFAMLQDHGFGNNGPYWPPTSGDCKWEHHYPYPGEATQAYPFGTWPNATMWNCWYGFHVSSAYFHTLATHPPGALGGGGTTGFGDRPILWTQA
jgi:hypothetical protein